MIKCVPNDPVLCQIVDGLPQDIQELDGRLVYDGCGAPWLTFDGITPFRVLKNNNAQFDEPFYNTDYPDDFWLIHGNFKGISTTVSISPEDTVLIDAILNSNWKGCSN